MQNVGFDIDVVAVVGFAILGIIWFVRLESKVMYQDKELVRLEKQIDESEDTRQKRDMVVWEKLDHMQETMGAILQTLAAVQAKLEK